MAIKRFAAIDIGSFEIEMGIYEIDKKQGLKRIDRLNHVVALGTDTYKEGRISYKSVSGMCDILKGFSDTMKMYKVDAYVAYATSALRESENSIIILDKIKINTGIDIKIISNSEQRFISYKAIASKGENFVDNIKEKTAIVDIGYGSIQLTLYDKGNIVNTQNINLGVLRLKEILSSIDAYMEESVKSLEELIDYELNIYKKFYLKDISIKNIIGIGEPLLYLFCRSGLDKDIVTKKEFMSLYDRLSRMSMSELEDRLDISHEFANIVLPCLVLTERIMKRLSVDSIWIPKTSLIDGMAVEYAQNNKLLKEYHNFEEDIISAARHMSERYRENKVHSSFVEDIALEIFDAMKKIHGLSQRDRLLLRIAAILHNCGKFISIKNAAECTYNIISTAEIIGISHIERLLIAQVAKNNLNTQLHTDTSVRVAKLTAIIRLSDALDKSHKQKLKDISIRLNGDKLLISTAYNKNMDLEIMNFNKYKAFFEEIYGIEPVLKQKRGI